VKALPLNQPWATLVAIGAKRIETRGYHPRRLGLHVGQRIAIYATKGIGPEQTAAPVRRALRVRPFPRDVARRWLHYPRGSAARRDRLHLQDRRRRTDDADLDRNTISERERAFGYYASGRWGWTLIQVDRIEPPLAATTRQQGAFDWPPRNVASGQGTLL
jgi:hypothetical protein